MGRRLVRINLVAACAFVVGGSLFATGAVGTNFSINAAFYTGYATRERRLRREQYGEITLGDTVPGIVAPGIVTVLVIVVVAAVTAHTGVKAATLGELANVLEPVAGTAGSKIFALDFFAAAFSSMVANATAGGTLLSDGLGWGNALTSLRVKALILVVLAFGLTVTLVAGGQSPMQHAQPALAEPLRNPRPHRHPGHLLPPGHDRPQLRTDGPHEPSATRVSPSPATAERG